MKRARCSLILAILTGLGSTSIGSAQSLHEVANLEVQPHRPGFVIALIQDGNVSFLEAFGAPGQDTVEVLTTDLLFAFPALTEMLAGATIQAAIDAEVLDPEAPISTFFPFISPRLGTLSVNQLLTHSGGLDDARIQDRFTWSQVMDQLNDAVLFTDPGMIHSRSRYSLPLAVRAVEKAVGQPFSEIVEVAILNPLGMTRSTFDLEKAKELGLAKGIVTDTSNPTGFREVPPETEMNGLPVLFTTAEDVLRFLASWMGRGIRGTPPWTEDRSDSNAQLPGDFSLRWGVEVDSLQGHLRASRTGSNLGLSGSAHFFPKGNTALVSLAIGPGPSRTIELALERVTAGLGPGSAFSAEAAAAALKPTLLPSHEAGWAGRYLNGDRKVELRRERTGLVYQTATEVLDVKPGTGGDMVATRRPTGQLGLYLQLVLDSSGRRYAIVGGKAFIHEKDARAYPHGHFSP